MRYRFFCFVLVLAAVFGGTPARAQGAARSLDIPPGARQNGMGEAGVALESDPADALWWNPAALGFAEWQGVSYSRAKLLPGLTNDVIHQHVAGGGRVRKGFGVGASGTFLTYGPPDLSYFDDDEDTEWSAAVAAGAEVVPGFAVGATAKTVHANYEAMGIPRTSTVGFDIGALYRHEFEPIRFAVGFNAQNLGPKMKFEGLRDESRPLSRNLKAGFSAVVPFVRQADGFEAGATVVIDFNHSWVTPDFEVENYGAELYAVRGRLLRVAARAGYVHDDLGEITDATFGFGARVAGLSFDYAEIPQADGSGLPRVKKWTLGLHTDLLLERLAAK